MSIKFSTCDLGWLVSVAFADVFVTSAHRQFASNVAANNFALTAKYLKIQPFL